ncbi:MAG: hypothetical protein JXA28_05345, partial [Bacteroidetes bacterium]|nr:hypothetical protein [Bacteroidota bacterium]
DYDNTNDPGLWATTHTVSGTITVADLLVTVGTTDYVECSSCHDPHDDTNGNLLRVSNTSSTLCLGCHNK